jgi:predicted phage terminase large subunit-like protein
MAVKLNADVLEGFTNTVLRKYFDGPTETPDFHRKIWEYCCSPDAFVAIAAPRSHAKSTVVTHSYTLATLLFRERDYAIIVSETVAQSIQFLGDIKKELLDNEDLRALFGVSELVKDTEDDLICRMEDGHMFRVQAKGAEQKVRGLKWKAKRPNLIICDDLEGDECVQNKERRDKFKRWFNGALLPCRSDTGIVRIVGTILHLDSLLEGLMPERQLGSSKIKSLVTEPLAQYSSVRTPWKSIKFRAHTDDFSSILWSERWSKKKLIEERARYVAQGLGDVYSQEYLNVPLDESNTFFRRAEFLPRRDEDKKLNLNYYITADLAISQRERSDYSVFAVAGMDDSGRLHLVNIIRDRMDAQQIVDTILMLQRLYKPSLFGIEAGTIQKSIGPFLNKEMLQTGTFVSLQLLKPSADKITRARSIQARMRANACKFDKDAEWYQDFEDELMKFPRDRHDDQVDAWAYMGLMLDKMQEADSPEELEEEEYLGFLKENQKNEGRSAVTGY